MKKGLVIGVLVAVVAAGGVGGYMMYQQKQQEKSYEEKMAKTISELPPIVVYEQEDLPSVEEEFAGTESIINIDSIEPNIENVYTTEPGEYEVIYNFKDSNGENRTATVDCIVKPELTAHVTGMKNIEIDKGEALPEEPDVTFDEYIDSVTLNTDEVDNEEAGVYDISYSILGADGEMKTAEGYKCTVNEVALPTPSPVPTKKPESTKVPEKNQSTTENAKEETTGENANPAQSENQEAVGNVEVQENVVETGDENNLIAIGIVIILGVAAIAGVVVYKKKKKQ